MKENIFDTQLHRPTNERCQFRWWAEGLGRDLEEKGLTDVDERLGWVDARDAVWIVAAWEAILVGLIVLHQTQPRVHPQLTLNTPALLTDAEVTRFLDDKNRTMKDDSSWF